MSKRPSADPICDTSLFPKRQATLHAYFPTSTGNSTCPRSIAVTPESIGIHTYDANSIENSVGFDKEYREFWNTQAVELCANKAVTQKLKTKKEIEGAINTKWTLHKTELLSLLAEKVSVRLSQVYNDPIVQGHSMLTIKNMLRMLQA